MTKKSLLAILLAQAFTVLAHAEPQRMSDEELSGVVGQGFINITTAKDNASATDFTRVNFGGLIETQLNVPSLKLGQYSRSYSTGTGTAQYGQNADLNFSNLALGVVNDSTGAVTPFSIKDPYIEFAYKGNKVVGVRLGMGEAHGMFSAEFNSFSGNFNFRMQGTGSELKQAACSSSFLSCIGTLLLIDDRQMYMADGTTVSYDHNRGAASQIRATHVGLANGTSISKLGANDAPEPILLSGLQTGNCMLVDLVVCFPNTNFQSFQVGSASRPAKDIFLSMQSERISWLNSRGEAIQTNAGVFFNVPKTRNEFGVDVPVVFLNFLEKTGLARQDSCFGPQTKGC